MTKDRENLHALLVSVLGTDHVYYQPPESLRMVFPAIIYQRSNLVNSFADNSIYSRDNVYEVTVIDKDPDSKITQRISLLPFCRFDRHYNSNNLNHDVFTIYY